MKTTLITTLAALATLSVSTAAVSTIFSEDFENPSPNVAPGSFAINTIHVGWSHNQGANNGIETWTAGFTSAALPNGSLDTSAIVNTTYVASSTPGSHFVEIASQSAGSIYSIFTNTAQTGNATFSFEHGSRDFNDTLSFNIFEVSGGVLGNSVFSSNFTAGAAVSSTADWVTHRGNFTAVAGQDYAVHFESTLDIGRGNLIDNVVVSIPEPSSAALLGLGGLAVITRRKRS